MIYFDNSATTNIAPEVAHAMLPYLNEEFGNPSSKHYTLANNAKRAIGDARESVARLVGCEPDEVVFTSGSTESNNMILKGIIEYYGCAHIVTSPVEHPSILDTVEFLRTKGVQTTFADVDAYGRVDTNSLTKALCSKPPATTLVTIMWGNNELGSLNDTEALSQVASEYNAFFHTDATQVIGKLDVRGLQLNVRFVSLSAHKLHGPKGIGAAIIRKDSLGIRTPLTPLLHGGGQENEYRSGTLSVHNIVGFGKAAEIALTGLQHTTTHLKKLEDRLVSGIKEMVPTAAFNSDHKNKIPGIINVRFPRVNNELLIKKLAPIVAISTGSACSSSKPSHVLQSIGLTLDEIRSSVRISLSRFNTEDEVDEFLCILK